MSFVRDEDVMTMTGSNGGLRYDTGKLRYDLVPPDAIEELVRVFTVGARKYADRNWEKGMPWSKCLGPLERHLAKWKMGISRDEEYPELYHMAMVAWNAIALLTYEMRRIGENDVMGKQVNRNVVDVPDLPPVSVPSFFSATTETEAEVGKDWKLNGQNGSSVESDEMRHIDILYNAINNIYDRLNMFDQDIVEIDERVINLEGESV